jgi:hypothetical protein
MGRRRAKQDVLEYLESGNPDPASVPRRDRPEGAILADEFKPEPISCAEYEKARQAIGSRRRALTNASRLIDAPEVEAEARRESGPGKQTRREDQLRELLADPSLRELAKRLIAEIERADTQEATGEEEGDLSGFNLPKMSVEHQQSRDSEHARPVTKSRKGNAELPFLRTGQPLIGEFATLWDHREKVPRDEFVERFQGLLDQFHEMRTLGSFEPNRVAVQWVNGIAKKSRITLLFNDEAVTVRCTDTGQTGYFDLRMSAGATLKGSGTTSFPSLKVFSRTKLNQV